jgi:hypothetical protein
MWLILFFLVFLFPYQVFGGTYEYYTYGGYNAVVDAWRRIGLIFSDNSFKGLYFSVIILGIIILYFVVLARATLAGTARFNLAAWAVPVLIGVSTYIAFIVPKDTIIVYDTVLNKGPESIGGIPRIMAVTAGLINKVERGLIDIVRVSSSPVEDYGRNAGGTGFVVLSYFGDPITLSLAGVPTYVQQTAYQFVKDCLLFAVSNGDVSAQEINSGAKDYVAIINSAMNPGIPTVYYDSDGKEVDTYNGAPVTCREAGNVLINYINQYKDAIVRTSCAMSGYNIDNPNELNTCKSLIESTFVRGLIKATNGGGNLDLLAGQAFLAGALIQTINSINPESSIKIMATKEASSQYLGLAIHANTWLPIIKETLRAVSIAISPFVLLFAATPLVGRALSFILGMMVWVVTWSVIDAILHYSAVAQAQAASSEFVNAITAGTPGVMFFVLLPSYSLKVAAVFGAIRWAGLGLATVLTGMLIRFGGAALAMLAGTVTGAAQSAGAAMGRIVTDITSPVKADLLPTVSWTNAAVAAGGVGMLARGVAEFQSGGLAGQARAGNYLGAEKIAKSTLFSNVETVSRNVALGSPEIAALAGTIAGSQTREQTLAWQREMQKDPNILKKVAYTNVGQQAGTALGVDRLGRKYGISLTDYYMLQALGINFKEGVYQDPLVRAVEGRDGQWYLDTVSTGLLSASIKQLKQSSFEKLREKVQSALKKMSYEDLVQFYKDNRHLFSKEQREAIERALKEAEEKSRTTRERTTKTEEETKFDTTRTGRDLRGASTIGAGVNYGPFKVGLELQASAYYSEEKGETKRESTSHSNEQEEASRNTVESTIANALADVLAKQDLQATGKTLGKTFRNSREFSEALQAAEKYREAEALESALSVNALPLIVQRVADKEYSQYGIYRFNVAMRDLITAIHTGDVETIRKFTQELDKLREQPFFDSNILAEGQELKKEVDERLKEAYNSLSSQGPRPQIRWPWNGPVVKENPPNSPPPKGPKIPFKKK